MDRTLSSKVTNHAVSVLFPTPVTVSHGLCHSLDILSKQDDPWGSRWTLQVSQYLGHMSRCQEALMDGCQ